MMTSRSEVSTPMQDAQALAKLYGLTMRPHETPKMFIARIERHKKQLGEALKVEPSVEVKACQ